MKTKRFLCMILAIIMMTAVLLTACTPVSEDESENTAGSPEETESSSDETAEKDSESSEESSSETETVITDVMIGETIEAEYASDFTVAKIFSNDMVVQRGEHIRVWGFAPESENGKKVSGEFKGMFAEALIENGEWCIKFGARLEADASGAEMKIYAGENKTVTFTGVLVGDVYLVMGQSNAAYDVNSHLAYTDPATQGGGRDAIDENSIIRLNYLNNSGGAYLEKGSDYVYPDLENTKAWTKTTLANTAPFSAIGYYFARAMVEKSDNTVPVGLIEVARGGAPLSSFLPNELAEKHDTDYLNKITGKYLTYRSTEHQGRYLYNCYLAPVSRFAVAGAVWYQGESDNPQEYAQVYGKIFNDFIEHLRSTHNVINKDFPVFIAELAPIYKEPANYSGTPGWSYMETGTARAYMGLLPTTVKNCYIGSGSDLWNDRTFWNNLHPNNKFELSGRLADIAEVVIFGKGNLDNATGPIFHSAVISSDKKTAVIKFSNVGEGLTTADGGDAVQGIVGLLNKDFVYNTVEPASATITGKDEITVVFDEEIKAVAYSYSTTDNYGETLNLCNSAKIPAVAFITPYEEKKLDNFTPDGFTDLNDKYVRVVGKWFDTFTVDGEPLFDTGAVESQLGAAGNRIKIYEGSTSINIFGWIGFKYESLMFGYSIDGGNAVLKSYPLDPGDAVLSAGGRFAKRFGVNIGVSELSVGEHTISLLVLIDMKGEKVVKLLSFTAEVVERPDVHEGIDLPFASEPGYGLIASGHDEIKIDNTQLYFGTVNTKLEAANSKITVNKGTQKISYLGWIGFETTLNMAGYAINGNDPVIETQTTNAEQAVLNLGGANARRYLVEVDVSGLETGMHTVDILISINTTDGGEAVLKIISFTLEVK